MSNEDPERREERKDGPRRLTDAELGFLDFLAERALAELLRTPPANDVPTAPDEP